MVRNMLHHIGLAALLSLLAFAPLGAANPILDVDQEVDDCRYDEEGLYSLCNWGRVSAFCYENDPAPACYVSAYGTGCDFAGPAGACAGLLWNDRFKSAGAALGIGDGTLVVADGGMGSGFFGNTIASLVYVREGNTAQNVVLYGSANDGFPSDGSYEQGGVGVNTFSDSPDCLAACFFAGGAYYAESEDGTPSVGTEEYDYDGDGVADEAYVVILL